MKYQEGQVVRITRTFDSGYTVSFDGIILHVYGNKYHHQMFVKVFSNVPDTLKVKCQCSPRFSVTNKDGYYVRREDRVTVVDESVGRIVSVRSHGRTVNKLSLERVILSTTTEFDIKVTDIFVYESNHHDFLVVKAQSEEGKWYGALEFGGDAPDKEVFNRAYARIKVRMLQDKYKI